MTQHDATREPVFVREWPRELRLRAGTTVMITEGDYGDYMVRGFVICTRDIDPPAVLAQYRAEGHGRGIGDSIWTMDASAFLAWLIARGDLVEVPEPPVEWFLSTDPYWSWFYRMRPLFDTDPSNA